jgi:serine/threonine protein kinase
MDDHTIEESSPAADSPTQAGEVPFPYERIEEIGDGGIGTVYRGRQTRLDRDVAIKEINNLFDIFADLQRSDIVQRFESIARQQAKLSHPNVVQVLDLITETEHPYVVTEYAPNGNLRRLIDSDEKRSLELVLKYFVQILHGLNAAHEEGVVHGSIKPENVLLDPAGNARLSDFGISRLVDLSGTSDQVYVGVGSVEYMPPEQIRSSSDATVESDIYALGIMFYEMLTGKVPGRRSPMPSSFYPEIPRALDDIFDKMSMDVAEDRYGSIDDILVDFYRADEIVDLLDRETGVVFLRDPIEEGEARFVDGDDATRTAVPDGQVAASGGDSNSESFETEGTDAGMPVPGDDDDRTTESHDEETATSETSENDVDTSSDDEPDDREETAVPKPDETSGGEEASAPTDQSEDDEETASTSDTPTDEVDGDDEVLDKLDTYGELFED